MTDFFFCLYFIKSPFTPKYSLDFFLPFFIIVCSLSLFFFPDSIIVYISVCYLYEIFDTSDKRHLPPLALEMGDWKNELVPVYTEASAPQFVCNCEKREGKMLQIFVICDDSWDVCLWTFVCLYGCENVRKGLGYRLGTFPRCFAVPTKP